MRQTGSVDDVKTYEKVRDIQNVAFVDATRSQTINGVSAKNTVLTITTARPIEAGLVARIGTDLYRITPNLIGMGRMKRYDLEVNNG